MEAVKSQSSYVLSRHRAGSVREMFALFVPLVFSIFSGSLMGFCDRLFICHYSLDSLNAVTAANYFCLLFQLAVSYITSMTQVCVGKSYGEGVTALAGPYCWQMIWFSFLSMALTLPTGIGLIPYLFGGKAIAAESSAYFSVLMYGNFLFPLSVALASYFAALGKTKVVGICSFGAQIVNIALNYLLIFGIGPGMSPLGVRGAALSTLFSQALLCVILLILFLKEPREYQTSKCSFNKALFKEVMFLGFPRALGRILNLVTWNMTVLLITGLQGDYLLVLSIGCSLSLAYTPFLRALEQVVTTQVAFYRGKKAYPVIWKSVRSGAFFLLVCFFSLGMLVFCLEGFLSFFLHEPIAPSSLAVVKLSCLWLWIFFFLEGINFIAHGLISGLGLTWFRLKLSVATSLLTAYLPFHLAFLYWNLTPDKIWMLCWLCVVLSMSVGFIKGKMFVKKLSVQQGRLESLTESLPENIV